MEWIWVIGDGNVYRNFKAMIHPENVGFPDVISGHKMKLLQTKSD